MATHDPLLALMGDKRIVINNGGIHKIMDITNEEKKILEDLTKLDNIIQNMRNKLRYGKIRIKFKYYFLKTKLILKKSLL